MALSNAVVTVRRDSTPVSGRRRNLLERHSAAAVLLVAAIIISARVVNPFFSPPLTSDESLYLSEAVSIAHGRMEYSSGEPIVHRPPLYPASIAPLMRLTGNSVPQARIVPLLYALGAVAALFGLARALFGTKVAVITALLTAAADAPGRLNGSFNVDTAAAMWLLGSAAVLAHGRADRAVQGDAQLTAARGAVSGALLGLAFLTKETTALWLPLPVLAALLSSSTQGRWRASLSFYPAFSALAAPWCLWVAWHTSEPFKLEAVVAWQTMLFALGGAVLLLTVGGLLHSRHTMAARAVAAALIAAAAAGAALYVLESRPEPHAVDYLRTVPEWTVRVFATNVEPFPLIVVAWAAAFWSLVLRRDERMVFPLVMGVLGVSLYVFVANRGWEVRQILPLVYLSYMLLAWATVASVRTIARAWTQSQHTAILSAIVIALMATAGVASRLAGSAEAFQTDDPVTDWRNPAEGEIASWLRELPEGSTVLSSRLYATQLYVETDGRLRIQQLPTLGVTISKKSPEPKAIGTFFRYEDESLDREASRTWVYLHRYADASYYIGLAAEDLESLLNEGETYVLLTGDDAGFSSHGYITNFISSSAFTALRAYDDGLIRSNLFRLDVSQPVNAKSWPLALRWEDAQQISLDAGDRGRTEEFWKTLAPNGVLLSGQLIESADLAALLRDEG